MEATFDTPRGVRIIVENAVGRVAITASDTQSTLVTVEADSASAQELVDQATVECRPAPGSDTVVIKIHHRHGAKFMRRNAVTVRVVMPIGGDVDVTTASADVDLRGVMGAVNVKTASGDVAAVESSGDVEAKTASGDLSVGNVGGSLRLYSASGDLRADRVTGAAAVSTASGDIELGSVGDRVDIRCTTGQIRLGQVRGDATIVGVSGDVRVASYGAGRMKVRAVSGDVSVGIAKGVNLTVDAESMSGTVRSEIPLGDAPMNIEGAPSVVLTARSVSGDVLVERAAVALAG